MQEMEQHLLGEDEELQRQHRMVEIDRREAELYAATPDKPPIQFHPGLVCAV